MQGIDIQETLWAMHAGVMGATAPEWLFLVAICGLAALALLLRAGRHRRARARNVVLLDGSNIMYWRGGTPDIATLRAVIAQVAAQGLTPGVVFDANAGYKLEGRYLGHAALARRLDLPPQRVIVVNRGEVADGLLLRAARDYRARVVSNDRFRDWAEDFPEVARPGFLIAGRFRDDALELDIA